MHKTRLTLSFKAEILVTAVTNWTLLYHRCGKLYTTNNLGVQVKPFWYQSLFMDSTVNYDSHLKWRSTWFRAENKIEKHVSLVQTKTKRVVRKGPLQVLSPFRVTPFVPPKKSIFPFFLYTHGRKVAGLIWIRCAAEALRFSFAKLSRPTQEMWKSKVKSIIIFRFKVVSGICHPKIWNPSTTSRSGRWKLRCLNQYKIFECLVSGTLN